MILIKRTYILWPSLIILVCLSKSGSATLYHELSSLEKSVVDEGLAIYELMPDDEPLGKIVRTIYVVTGAPFSTESGLFTYLNYLHVNTKEHVIRREIFQKQGDSYDPAAILDSEIALRAQGQIRSLAVIVPVKREDSNGQEVDLLVATRDLLSLHPTFGLKGSLSVFSLMVALGENNLFGYNKSVAGAYEWQQGAHIISGRYFDPRLFGSRFQFNVKPSLVFSRDPFKFDGFLGDLRLEMPLLSQTDRFGYGIDISYGSRSLIDFNGAKIRTYDISTVNGIESYERKYRWRYGKGSLFGRYSFGTTYKKEVFASYGLNIKRPSILNEERLTEVEKDIYRKNILPRNELESFITLGFSYFHNNFLTLYDYDNFKLQELKRIGPNITLSNDFSSKDLFLSDTNFLRPELKLSYLQPFNSDSFINLSVSTSNRYDGKFTDNIFKYGITLISPKFFDLLRIIFEGRLSTVSNNRDNQKFVIGSDSGIRGVESRFYIGDKGFRANVELRSAPLEVWIFHTGFVIFYDVGAAFDRWRDANATHAIGFGLRFLAPQISSLPFRIDLAFPVYGIGKKRHVMVPSFGTGQAF